MLPVRMSIEVTLTVDVNEPVGNLVTEADELPDSPNAVTYSMVDRDEDGETTDVEDDIEEEETDTFAVTVEAGNRDTPLTIVDLNGLVDDDDIGSLKFGPKRAMTATLRTSSWRQTEVCC